MKFYETWVLTFCVRVDQREDELGIFCETEHADVRWRLELESKRGFEEGKRMSLGFTGHRFRWILVWPIGSILAMPRIPYVVTLVRCALYVW